MNFLSKNKLAITGVLVGAIAGYLYYHFIGCASGTCPITSKPLNSTLYGAMMGGLFFSLFKKEKTNSEQNKNSDQ
jgi:phage shock protein E